MRARRRASSDLRGGGGGGSWEDSEEDVLVVHRDGVVGGGGVHGGDGTSDEDGRNARQWRRQPHRRHPQNQRYSDSGSDDDDHHEHDDRRPSWTSTPLRQLRSPPSTRPLRVPIPWQSLFSPTPKKEERTGSSRRGHDEQDDDDEGGYDLEEHDHGSCEYYSDDVYSGDDDGCDRRRRGGDQQGAAARGTRIVARGDGLHHRGRGRVDSNSNHHLDTPVAVPPLGASPSYRTSPRHQQTLARPNLLRGSSHSSSPSKSKGKRRWSCSNWLYRCRNVRSALVMAALLYLFLVVHVYRRVSSQNDANHVLVLSYQLEKRRLARSYLNQKQAGQIRDAHAAIRNRANHRRATTLPPRYRDDDNNDDMIRRLRLVRDRPVDATLPVKEGEKPESGLAGAASMEELCGFYAQNASLAEPHLFPRRHSLTTASGARVLITGILNPIGVNLALTLKERCGVQSIIGIDHLFPNAVASRMSALPVIEMLHNRLGSVLERPILAAHVALEPRASGISSKDAVYLESFAEGRAQPWLDLVETFRPSHIVHLASYSPEAYQTSILNEESPPDLLRGIASMYSLRSSLSSMEQVLQSIANAPADRRPAFLYASSSDGERRGDTSSDVVLHHNARAMDEVLAKSYHRKFGVHSLAVRIPNAVFGPWDHVETATYKILDRTVRGHSNEKNKKSKKLDLLYVGDVVEGLVAAMQFRTPLAQALAFEFAPVSSTNATQLLDIAKSLLDGSEVKTSANGAAPLIAKLSASAQLSRQYLDWSPSTPLADGLVKALAWNFDRVHPYGLRDLVKNSSGLGMTTGDTLLQRHGMPTCDADDLVCHSGAQYFPCASECSSRSQCTPSVFDSIIPVVHEVFDGCDAVLYTHALGGEGELTLETEYMDEGNPLVCTVAFVSFESPFVQGVVQKVPDSELAKLGVSPRHEDGGTPESIHKLKHKKLNGRLLYLGWLLVWPEVVPDVLSHADQNLLKLSPGRLFPPEVKYGIFIEQSFGASPRSDDALFLINSMIRPASSKQIVKNKNPPKAKFELPPEPEKKAVLLMSELRRQESPTSRVHSTSRLSVKQASRYMRYEVGEYPLGRESAVIKQQREFYERAMSLVNSNTMRSPAEPLFKLEFRHLARTRWVVHDMQLEDGRQLRCDWYREHLQWHQSPLDQLSFAYVLAKRDVNRRVENQEADDRVRMRIADQIELKTLLTDVFEWHALQTEANRQYTPLTEIRSLPYNSMDDLRKGDDKYKSSKYGAFLFARIISDRTLAAARNEWTASRKAMHGKSQK